MSNYYLEVDASEVVRLANELAEHVGQERAQKILDRTLWKTAKTLKAPISKELRNVYAAKASFIKDGIQNPVFEADTCVIPLSGARGIIGTDFPRKGTRKNIKVEILKGKASSLPPVIPHQGGNPPFRAGKGVRTRKTDASRPAPRVPGIALPQMPMPPAKGNKPVERVIEEKMITIMDRACHEILGGYVK